MSDDGEQGPFRDNARPPDARPRWSVTAVASPLLVISGWLTTWYALAEVESLIYVGGLLLVGGGAAGAFGLIETKPGAIAAEPREGDAPGELPVPAYQGRNLAKLGLGCLLGPVLLGCVGFGLLLLTCGGH